jgi:hypothetical protein
LETFVAFGLSGFGAVQTYPAPQVFQALSLANAPPLPPAPPYGNPNPNLVAVARNGNPALPANLTLAAHPAFQAILRVTGQTVLLFAHPPLAPVPNTTSAVSATNPSVSGQLQGPSPVGGSATAGDLPNGPVSFQLTAAPANLTSGADALQQTLAQLQHGAAEAAAQSAAANASANASSPATNAPAGSNASTGPAGGSTPGGNAPAQPAPAPAPSGSTVTTPAVASPSFVARIVQTVQSLAIGAVYSAPVFSFSA